MNNKELMEKLKKLRIKKDYGTWYYEKCKEIDVDWYLYDLYEEVDDKKKYVGSFATYADMFYFIKYGINLSL